MKKIFEEIDKIILECIKEKPVKFKDSDFLKKYLKLKEKYLNDSNNN